MSRTNKPSVVGRELEREHDGVGQAALSKLPLTLAVTIVWSL